MAMLLTPWTTPRSSTGAGDGPTEYNEVRGAGERDRNGDAKGCNNGRIYRRDDNP